MEDVRSLDKVEGGAHGESLRFFKIMSGSFISVHILLHRQRNTKYIKTRFLLNLRWSSNDVIHSPNGSTPMSPQQMTVNVIAAEISDEIEAKMKMNRICLSCCTIWECASFWSVPSWCLKHWAYDLRTEE